MSSNIYLRAERSSGLFGRDSCSDAFGSNAMNSICAPSNTLCCVRRNQAFPSCQQYLGRGWCCVGEKDEDNCYVDGPSACDEPNSVPCTNLASGVTKACCPRLTSCHNDYKASLGQVRCNIRQIDLKNAARTVISSVSSTSSSSTSTSTTTVSIESTTSSTSTTVTTGGSSATAANVNETSTTSKESGGGGGVSGGVIAGAVIGPTFVLAALVLLGCFFYRRRNKKANIQNELPANPGMQPPMGQAHQPSPSTLYSSVQTYYDAQGRPQYPNSQSPPLGPDGYPVTPNAPVEIEAKQFGGNYYAAELPGR
ncbi:hypothetical protein QBC42DRAFT_345736 [Cladorrhinum samala]|uniref:Mid2 domain-containing protein n=1 Tax=Cladorrhinum samala TaxID=585594 RepID=A0AAV9HQS6_9PEZI|nr:hypothetical protein QBC42DRAFT_345736 [Cladorrhinum samala]